MQYVRIICKIAEVAFNLFNNEFIRGLDRNQAHHETVLGGQAPPVSGAARSF